MGRRTSLLIPGLRPGRFVRYLWGGKLCEGKVIETTRTEVRINHLHRVDVIVPAGRVISLIENGRKKKKKKRNSRGFGIRGAEGGAA